MNAGENTPAYGESGNTQDGQIRPIPVPGQPGANDPALAPSGASVPAPGGANPPVERKGGTMAGLLAISSTLALIAFIIIGVVFDGWAWGWVVFLIPGLLKTWQAAQN